MCFATLLPLGILQLYKSVDKGYFEARELKFLTNHTNALIEWLRLPGDVVFIAGGAVPALYIAYLGIRHTVKQVTLEEPDDILFTDIHQPEGVRRGRRRGGGRREAHVSAEVLLAAGYAGFLTCGAFALEWLSAHTHRRALRYRTAGFDYDGPQDHWLCPEGEQLWPHEFDRELRLVRYRARAHGLQRLPEQAPLHRLRQRPRDRASARPVAALRGRPLPPRDRAAAGRARARWCSSSRRRATTRRPRRRCCSGLLVPVALAARWLLRDLRVHPANFPEPTASQGLRLPAGALDAEAAQLRR